MAKTERKSAPRARPRLTTQDVETIVTILETWDGPLTWELLIERSAQLLGRAYTRQALDAHEQIKTTFQARKRRMRIVKESLKRGKPLSDDLPPELAAALQRAEAAELRVASLEKTIENYRAKFVRWLYNARLANLDEERLNADLPKTNQKAGALWGRKGSRR